MIRTFLFFAQNSFVVWICLASVLTAADGNANLRPGFDPKKLALPDTRLATPTPAPRQSFPAQPASSSASPAAQHSLGDSPGNVNSAPNRDWQDIPNPYRTQGSASASSSVRTAGLPGESSYSEYGPEEGFSNARPDESSLTSPDIAEPDGDSLYESDSESFNAANLRPTDKGASPIPDGVDPTYQDPLQNGPPASLGAWKTSFWNALGSRPHFATLPEVFGGGTFTSSRAVINDTFALDVAPGGLSQRVGISQHNKAMTDDRFYFVSQNFANGSFVGGPGGVQFGNVDRYWLGVERSFADGAMSIELRLPFSDGQSLAGPGIAVGSDSVGNLTTIIKGILFDDPSLSLSTGFGVSSPTAGSVIAQAGGETFLLENNAVHLLPFLAVTAGGEGNWFASAFLQGDLACSGNVVRFNNQTAHYNEQNLLQGDLSIGAWLVRDAYASHLRDLALITEFQHIAALQDSDVVQLSNGPSSLLLSNTLGSSSMTNFTVGLHGKLASGVTLRAGWTTPLSESDRFFDGLFTAAVSLQR
ncbi:hypothetical protein [Lignipirellula cremea]|uniref:Uncharacterized protein n=1 Tax=Lignipirellula cremea TaxID=2528010 RepID=A0A518DSP9_9BACT|nr:hypothetical protein [Lignipirellula cremea]QDU94859.1 hypothetical protein Pla8534_26670 [Lignipirellula cremea]